MEPPGQVIAGVFALSLNAARQIEDGNHDDELGSLLSRRMYKAGGFAVIFHLYILHKGRFGWVLNFSDICRQTPRRDPTSILPRTYPAHRRSVRVLMLSNHCRQTLRRDPTSILPRTYPARRPSVRVLMLL